MESLAVYPHTPTAVGTIVELRNFAGTFKVLGSFIAYQDGKKRHCYILADEANELCVALNTWHTPFSFLSERLAQLRAAMLEEADLRAALHTALGEQ